MKHYLKTTLKAPWNREVNITDQLWETFSFYYLSCYKEPFEE